ncbi:trace amine-associated receptor 8a-like [Salmo salar]|uniref:Trace amine-associated receptor 8a-like n=1 Tax=Salmo salar TaxID=8030 RepID=A0ABM3CQC2_SALSA|nr:trace amine-associated receptor 8a-like [Salmo salar]
MEENKDVQYCFQDGNSSCRKALLKTSIYITLYIFFSLMSAVTVFLNILVIISISHFKQLHTPTNLLILSLAASDLLVGLIVIPATTVAIMESCWGFGEYFCAFHYYIACLCTSLSLGNLVLISIDRYVAVCNPLLYHSKITTTRMMCCISVTWCCSIIYDAAIIKNLVNVQVPSKCLTECLIVEGSIWVNIIDLVITMVVPCSIIITLYMKIFVVARSQARKVFSKEAATSVLTSQSQGDSRSSRGTTASLCQGPVLVAVAVVFSSLCGRHSGARGSTVCYPGNFSHKDSTCSPSGAPHCSWPRVQARTEVVTRSLDGATACSYSRGQVQGSLQSQHDGTGQSQAWSPAGPTC